MLPRLIENLHKRDPLRIILVQVVGHGIYSKFFKLPHSPLCFVCINSSLVKGNTPLSLMMITNLPKLNTIEKQDDHLIINDWFSLLKWQHLFFLQKWQDLINQKSNHDATTTGPSIVINITIRSPSKPYPTVNVMTRNQVIPWHELIIHIYQSNSI